MFGAGEMSGNCARYGLRFLDMGRQRISSFCNTLVSGDEVGGSVGSIDLIEWPSRKLV
jgi:hypothetical protein